MPFVRSENPITTRVLGVTLLAALSARPAAALLSTPTVHLCSNTPAVTPLSVVGDFTEATFDGYTDAALPALVGPVNTQPAQIAVHGEVDFDGAAPQTAPQNITGYYVTDGGGTVLYAAELFPAAIPVVNPGDFISLDVILAIDLNPALPT